MMALRLCRLLAAAALLPLAVAAGCKARVDDFYAAVFPCDVTLAGVDCGLTVEGRPMTCFDARQLGGSTGFCAEACDPAAAPRDGLVCTTSGALLKKCNPQAPLEDSHLGCPTNLHCYRTSLTHNDGVCVMAPVCVDNSECIEGSKCASTVIAGLSKASSVLLTDHFQCLHGGCLNGGTQCPPRQTCVGTQFTFNSPLDDLCLPACDAAGRCPPNFSCDNDPVSSPGAPSICIPGLPGSHCAADQDCLYGICLSPAPDVEFKACGARGCHSDGDCKLFAGSEPYLCVGVEEHGGGVCVPLRLVNGANCNPGNPSACPAGFECLVYSTWVTNMPHGECRIPCDADGRCSPRGGIPHVCIGPNREGGCYPASLAAPCSASSDCIAPLTCEPAPPDPAHPSPSDSSPSICTAVCQIDSDCDQNQLTRGVYCSCAPGVSLEAGACPAGNGICRPRRFPAAPCDRDRQCTTGRCGFDHLCTDALVQ
jgi:hypothetical protein